MTPSDPSTQGKRAVCAAALAADPSTRCRCSPVDTPTRYQGTYARHKRACRLTHDPAARCSCQPSYWSRRHDARTGKMVKTRMMSTAVAARDAGRALGDSLTAGAAATVGTLRFAHAVAQFHDDCRKGGALNNPGRRFKRDAVADLDSSLIGHAVPEFGTRLLADLRRRDIQLFIDKLMTTPPKAPNGRPRRDATLSGSRIRSIIYGVSSLYAWALDRDLAEMDPTAHVRLPAVDARPRVVIARSPAEVHRQLLALSQTRRRSARGRPDVIGAGERLPFALAAYAGARRSEIKAIEVDDIDLVRKWIFLGVDENGRKSEAAQRALPLLPRLEHIILATLMESGRRNARGPGVLLCPGDRVRGRNSGRISFSALQTRADDAWDTAKLERDTAHRYRHYFASWLDAAGARPVVVSTLMGHRTPLTRSHDMAALVTQRVYTHALADDLAKAMVRLDRFISRSHKEAKIA